MEQFKADLHIHSLLSPCGSLEMSPMNIVNAALEAQLDIIAITDHNSTKQAQLIQKIGSEKGIWVICGAEINSAEEVHVLTLFESPDALVQFQLFINKHTRKVKNNPDLFGDQVVVDENEMIVEELEFLLINSLEAGLSEIETEVHHLGGLFIPAHIDRPYNGILSQLGMIPENLNADAFEISYKASIDEWQNSSKIPQGVSLLKNSDAHFPEQIGKGYTIFNMKERTFNELRKALRQEDGRSILV